MQNVDQITLINRWYDRRMFPPPGSRLYNRSDFHNWGYWKPDTRTLKEASENLMEELLAFIPHKTGTMLDVACGKGATTSYLLKYYRLEDVTGINISEKQLERCKVNAPGCKFLLMSATELTFREESFDNIICVEAAFHFNTRERFLAEAWRVLKPGGRLVLSDILWTRRVAEAVNPLRTERNYVRDLPQYSNLYVRSGFQTVEIIDATYPCWIQFYRHALRFCHTRFLKGEISQATFRQRLAYLFRRWRNVRQYPLVCARKAD